MFKRIVTLVRGLMGCQSTDRSLYQAEQVLPNAKPLPVKSTQTSKVVRKPRQSAPQPSLKKQKAVSQTLVVKEGQSKKQKPVQTAKQPSTLGKSTRTLAPQTPLLAFTQRKQKTGAVQSTLVARNFGKEKPTAQAVVTVSQPQRIGSKSKTVAPQTHQAASTQQNPKQKPVESTKVVKKATKETTSVATPMARKR
jgi:hypothetical protein